MNIDKTLIFAVDGQNFAVAELPIAIRKQFEILDAYRQRQQDLGIDLSMANTSVAVKSLELQELIRQFNAPKTSLPDEAPMTPQAS